MIYAFADYELDTRLYELRRNLSLLQLEPQVLDVLTYLIENRDRVVPKQEFLERLWPGRAVSEASLSYSIMCAREAIGDNGQRQCFIQTRYRRGYRFVAPVSQHDQAA
jgi:DNA-binding winged helix-turn-helix (wHTH) protein